MSILPIIKWPDERLTRKCEPIAEVDETVRAFSDDLLETMYDAKGRGLAAPQVGDMRRIFVMDATWKEEDPSPIVMVNPRLLASGSRELTLAEGCLSIPGITTDIKRPVSVTMSWTALDGSILAATLKGPEARCALHELDHLNGVLTLDHLSEDERKEALAAYEAANG